MAERYAAGHILYPSVWEATRPREVHHVAAPPRRRLGQPEGFLTSAAHTAPLVHLHLCLHKR